MDTLPFGLPLVRHLADHRSDLLTPVFQLLTLLGEIEGYVLLVTLVYVAWDKGLAVRLAALTLVAMSLNHVAKTLVANPRPFVADGSWLERWAVSPARARDLVTEFSTPSGHAMAGAAFYATLYASVRQRAVRVAAVVLLLGTGLSRPYLGVHYLEDVLAGWLLGGALALLALAHAERLRRLWQALGYARQVGLAVAASAAIWLATRVLHDWGTVDQPSAFVSYAGFLTGLVVARPLEASRLDFDPRSGGPLRKALRLALSVAMTLGVLVLLDDAPGTTGGDASLAASLLRYVRYTLAGVVGIFVAPWLFVRLGWAATMRGAEETRGDRAAPLRPHRGA